MSKYTFSKRSLKALEYVHFDLVRIATKVLELGLFDFGISCGHRKEDEQEQLYFEGKSKLRYPHSKHNSMPSTAIDIVLYVNGKVDWNNRSSWYMAIGVFRGVAAMLNIPIRVGADWDGDFSTSDQSFHDLPHIELILGK